MELGWLQSLGLANEGGYGGAARLVVATWLWAVAWDWSKIRSRRQHRQEWQCCAHRSYVVGALLGGKRREMRTRAAD